VRGSLAQVLRGMLMGAADLVPGVSGGTVALVLGIYQQFIGALHSCVSVLTRLARGDVRGAGEALRHVPIVWLGSLAVGILTIVFVGARTLSVAIEEYPVQLAGLFCGLIASAVVICWRQLRQPERRHVVVLIVSATLTFVLLGLSPASDASGEITTPLWGFFVGGAIAITAMVLPGVSGSFILVLLGLYAQVLAAVSDRNLLVIAVFMLGCLTGLGVSSTTLRWLLHHYHDLVLAAMIGLMVGSIRILWPWPGGFQTTELGLPTASEWAAPTLLALAGLAVVLTLDAVALRMRGVGEEELEAEVEEAADELDTPTPDASEVDVSELDAPELDAPEQAPPQP
jgi:putative membrane protein